MLTNGAAQPVKHCRHRCRTAWFAQEHSVCHMHALHMDVFGVSPPAACCGVCDSCRARPVELPGEVGACSAGNSPLIARHWSRLYPAPTLGLTGSRIPAAHHCHALQSVLGKDTGRRYITGRCRRQVGGQLRGRTSIIPCCSQPGFRSVPCRRHSAAAAAQCLQLVRVHVPGQHNH